MKLYKSLSQANKDISNVTALKLNLSNTPLPRDVFHFPYLKELYLEGELLTLDIPRGQFDKLKILTLKFNQVQGQTNCLFNLPSLELLKIIETPIKNLSLPLGQVSSPIKSLTLKNCKLENLPEEIFMLTDLEELNLSNNQLIKLPENFSELKKLKRLNLDSNLFEEFPDLIKKMTSLRHLSIDHNKFSESEKARIQRSFHISPV